MKRVLWTLAALVAFASPALAGNTGVSQNTYRYPGAIGGAFYGRADGVYVDTATRSLVAINNGQPILLGKGFNESFVGTTALGFKCLTLGLTGQDSVVYGQAPTTTANGLNGCKLGDGFYFGEWSDVNSSSVPTLSTGNGLDINAGATSTQGLEISSGYLDFTGAPFVAGVDPDFYTCATFNITTVAGTTVTEVGLRDPETFITTYVTYADYLTIGSYAGTVETDTNVASGGHTLTSTTQSVSNATAFTVCAASVGGVSKFTLNGAVPTVTQSVTLTAGQAFIPYIFTKQSATTSAHVYVNNWATGYCPAPNNNPC